MLLCVYCRLFCVSSFTAFTQGNFTVDIFLRSIHHYWYPHIMSLVIHLRSLYHWLMTIVIILTRSQFRWKLAQTCRRIRRCTYKRRPHSAMETLWHTCHLTCPPIDFAEAAKAMTMLGVNVPQIIIRLRQNSVQTAETDTHVWKWVTPEPFNFAERVLRKVSFLLIPRTHEKESWKEKWARKCTRFALSKSYRTGRSKFYTKTLEIVSWLF